MVDVDSRIRRASTVLLDYPHNRGVRGTFGHGACCVCEDGRVGEMPVEIVALYPVSSWWLQYNAIRRLLPLVGHTVTAGRPEFITMEQLRRLHPSNPAQAVIFTCPGPNILYSMTSEIPNLGPCQNGLNGAFNAGSKLIGTVMVHDRNMPPFLCGRPDTNPCSS